MNQRPENQRPEYSAFLLDLDGTLIDSYDGIEWSLHNALEQVLPDCPRLSLRPLVGPPLPDMIRIYLLQHYDVALNLSELAATVEELVAAFRRYYDDEGCTRCEPYPHVESTLQALHQNGIRKIIVTNKPTRPTSIILERLEWLDYFEAIICPDTIEPNFSEKIESARYALHNHNLTSWETLFVGDSTDDALAASQNALDFAAVLYGYGAARDHSARYQIEDFGQLLSIVGLERTAGVAGP